MVFRVPSGQRPGTSPPVAPCARPCGPERSGTRALFSSLWSFASPNTSILLHAALVWASSSDRSSSRQSGGGWSGSTNPAAQLTSPPLRPVYSLPCASRQPFTGKTRRQTSNAPAGARTASVLASASKSSPRISTGSLYPFSPFSLSVPCDFCFVAFRRIPCHSSLVPLFGCMRFLFLSSIVRGSFLPSRLLHGFVQEVDGRALVRSYDVHSSWVAVLPSLLLHGFFSVLSFRRQLSASVA